MATTYNHVQIGVVDAKGNVNVLYPINTAEDVSVNKSNNKNIPSSVSSVQDIIDNIGAMAFENGSDLVYLADASDYEGTGVDSEINDADVSAASAWSSKKMNTHMERFAPSYENTLEMVNSVPITATKKVINGKDNNYVALCPTTNCIWFVDYVPYVSSVSQVAGLAGGTNTVAYAFERWTGHAFGSTTETPVVYERIYMNGAWGPFKKVSYAFEA